LKHQLLGQAINISTKLRLKGELFLELFSAGEPISNYIACGCTKIFARNLCFIALKIQYPKGLIAKKHCEQVHKPTNSWAWSLIAHKFDLDMNKLETCQNVYKPGLICELDKREVPILRASNIH
jgi:hypothetical protein